MKVKLKKAKKFLLDLFFPSFCVGCHEEGNLLCRKCQKQIITVQATICPECSKLSDTGRYCERCRKDKALRGIIVATYYEEGPIKEMIHNFKYNHALELKKVLSNLLAQAVNQKKFDLITFAPLHRRRLAERGFNQAEILAEETSMKLKLPCVETLIKTKSTKRQVGLTGGARRQNLDRVFKIKKGIDITKKKILIIDDITTTGTTLNECAKVLKTAGAKEVWGLVVARG